MEHHIKMHGNEWIRELISHGFTFFKRGMLGVPTLGPKVCQFVLSANAC